MNDFFTALWELTLEMAPYLLLGFGIAGLLHAFVPTQTYHKYLSRPGFRSVCNATLLGIPLPLCSCGVLPTTVSLRRSGASRGACTSFLIATPQTGVDSILATYSLLGLPFAIIRPVAALVTGVMGGVATDFAFRHDAAKVPDGVTGTDAAAHVRLSFMAKLKKAFGYAFGELLEDVGRWLVIGLLVAAVITVAVPDNFFAILQQWPLLNMLLVLLIAIPMYVCATGSIPIALSLMLKGMTPGAAFVLLMAGPAINAASMLVIDKAFGRKQTAVYLLSIITGAISFGLIIDYLLPAAWFMPQAISEASACGNCIAESPSWWKILCSVAFALLLLRALWRRFFKRSGCGCHDTECGCHASDCQCHGQESCSAGQTLRMKVSGMRCNHCVANVKSALQALPFVESAEVELTTGTVVLTGRQGMEMEEEIVRKEIEKAGYSVEE